MNSKTCRNSSFVLHRLLTEASGLFPEASGKLPDGFKNLPEGIKNLPGTCGRKLPASRAVHSPSKETLAGGLPLLTPESRPLDLWSIRY